MSNIVIVQDLGNAAEIQRIKDHGWPYVLLHAFDAC